MADKTFDLSVLLRVIDRASGPIRDVGRTFGRLSGPLKRISKAFQDLGKKVQIAGRRMRDIGKNLSMKLTAPIVLFGTLAIRSATSFQKSMNMVGAVTKATGEEFVKLEKLAKDLGAATEFSASQAAEGMKFLGMAGLSVNQIMGALPKTLELAASAQMELGDAADIVTNIMSGYRLETSDLARVNDVLVNAFTSSNTNLQQLGEGMKVVGPVAKAMQFRFTETAAALGILAKNAFQGTLGGTGLRRIMTNLVSITPKAGKMFAELGIKIFNTDGSLRDLTQVLASFEDAQAKGVDQMKLTQAVMEAFGQRGGPQFLALLGAGSKALNKFEKNLEETGTSARVAEAQMKGLPGAFKLLVSAFEAIQLAIVASGLGKWIEDVVRSLAGFLRRLSKINPQLLKIGTIIALVVAAIGPLIAALGMLGIFVGGLATLMTPLGLLILGIVAAIGLLAAGAYLVIKNWEPIKAFFKDLWGFMKEELGTFMWVMNELFSVYPLELIKKAWEPVKKYFADFWFGIKELFVVFPLEIIKSIGDMIGKVTSILPDWMKKGLGIKVMAPAKEAIPATVPTVGAKRLIETARIEGKSETDINIKLLAEPGTEATVEGVRKKKGDARVNVATIGYVGAWGTI